MKKILLTVASLCMVACVNQVTAQNKGVSYVSFGPVGSFGHSWVRNANQGNAEFKPSGALGIGVMYSRYEHWGFGGQLLVSHEGYSWEKTVNGDFAYEYNVTPIYLRIPMTANYFFGSYGDAIRPKVYLGPSVGIKLDERRNIEVPSGAETTTNDSYEFKTFDLGIQTGAGVNVRLARATWLNTDIGYYHGLLDATDIPGNSNNNINQNLRVNVGVMFGL